MGTAFGFEPLGSGRWTEEAPQRVVSLCPSTTELVCKLGAADRLVGRTRFCIAPSGLEPRVVACGGTKNPDLERILALAPDVVLMNAEENRREDAEALARAGLRVLVSMPITLEEVRRHVLELGKLLGLQRPAEELANQMASTEDWVRRRAAALLPWRFVYLIWRKPWMAVGPRTYVSSVLETAGGVNATSSFEGEARYPRFEPEQLAELSPDRVLLSSEPFPFGLRHIEELSELTRLEPSRFRLVDGQSCCWHGSRTVEGLKLALELAEEVTREAAGRGRTDVALRS